MPSEPIGREWWRTATVYQIYPMSFCDSNGDGIGDVPGITSKLDYLKSLGADVLWLSPIYASPNKDNGYDISDYRALDPRYGTMEDMDILLSESKKRGLKLMMDLVVNHTSSMHKWFLESRSSKTNPKRDWYIWRPPKYDAQGNRHPPNNWAAVWEGSAWEWDEETQEYYLHFFLAEQPDLNWENPDVRRAVFDLMHWWLQKGVSGFRMDVINLISKPDGLPDYPPEKEGELAWPMSCVNGPRVHEYLQEMNREVLSKYDTITVGECPWTHSPSDLAPYVLPSSHELNMVFTFHHVEIDAANSQPLSPAPWPLTKLKHALNLWQTHMHAAGGWIPIYIENHDQARSVTRFGNDSEKWRTASAKMLATMAIAQSGTVYVYQGQEIGMKNVPKEWGIEEYKDVASQLFWEQELEARRKSKKTDTSDMSDVLAGLQLKARDNARTPVQWNSTSPSGGFSSSPDTWMQVNPDYTACNAEAEISDEGSVWTFRRNALKTRKANPVLTFGSFRLVAPKDEDVFAIARVLEETVALIVLNFTATDQDFQIPSEDPVHGALPSLKLVLSNYDSDGISSSLSSTLRLRPYESRVYVNVTR